MSTPIIKIDNLGKKYIIAHGGNESNAGYVALRDVITESAKVAAHTLMSPFNKGNNKKKLSKYKEEFWAVRDVSLEINQGERVGLIGRNGAGKTTLLKLLSRITEPTTGRIHMRGRVASLLEVGTGFHPELSGRENIYMNGAILGMNRIEIKNKFSEIVEFAEVEKFLDTPVKRYSSGMHVRLAFAVAAHLEPEILLVDEVLAVGDYKFQEKCLGKMQEVSSLGRTIIFVSHNMKAISRLCNRTILINNGEVEKDGDTESVINAYTGDSQSAVAEVDWTTEKAPGNQTVRLRSVKICDENEQVRSVFQYTEKIMICVTYEVLSDANLYLRMYLNNEDGVVVLVSTELKTTHYKKGLYEAKYTIEPHYLNEGQYYLQQVLFKEGFVGSGTDVARVDYAVGFYVDYSEKYNGGLYGKHGGIIRPDWNWEIGRIGKNNI